MKLDKFKPLTVYTIYIAATPEKVWEALTSAEFSQKYFFGNSVKVEQKVGGAYIVRTPDGALHISGEVVECDPPRKLTFTFNVNWPALIEKLGPTLVSYEIEQAGDAVKLTHERIARPAAERRYSVGRPPGLARDPLQPEERAGDGKAAGRQDGPAGADAGGAEGIGNRDAVRTVIPGRASARTRNLGAVLLEQRIRLVIGEVAVGLHGVGVAVRRRRPRIGSTIGPAMPFAPSRTTVSGLIAPGSMKPRARSWNAA